MNAFPPPVDPDNLGRGPMIMGLTWTFGIIAIMAVALRFYIRINLKTGLAIDDWLMGVAVVVNTVSQAFVSTSYHFGLGKHDASMTFPEMTYTLKWMWLANTPGLIVAIVARVSIAILLIRLFGGVHAWFKWFLVGVTSFCTVLTIVIIPCTYLQSTPIAANWDLSIMTAKHWDPRIYADLAFLSQAMWTFTDLTFVLFPVLIIWRLHMALKQRLGLIILMSVSLITMILSILKAVGLQALIKAQTDPTSKDVLYNACLLILYSCLEQAFVIIMGCVPPLRGVMKLEVTQSLSSSLSSILRRRKASKSSMDSQKYESGGSGPYESLEMRTDRLARSGKGPHPSVTAVATSEERTGSQQGLVKKNGIMSTKETTISYSQHGANV